MATPRLRAFICVCANTVIAISETVPVYNNRLSSNSTFSCDVVRSAKELRPETVKGSARSAAVNTDEAGTGVIACRFAGRNFAVGLRIGHARFNLVQNLLFG